MMTMQLREPCGRMMHRHQQHQHQHQHQHHRRHNPMSMVPFFDQLAQQLSEQEQLNQQRQQANQLGLSQSETAVELKVDTTDYKPESIDVQVDGLTVTISGKEETQTEEGDAWTMKQFRRTFELPDCVVVEKLAATMSEDGRVLTVHVPKRQREVEEENKVKTIPIKITRTQGGKE